MSHDEFDTIREAVDSAVGTTYGHTDLGNSDRLVDLHYEELRYVEAWRSWLAWDGSRWKRSESEVRRRAISVVRDMQIEVAAITNDPDRAKALFRHAMKSQGAGKVAAMCELAQVDARVQAEAVEFDADPWLLNAPNGTIELKAPGGFREHRRADLISKQVACAYDPDAECPLWMECLERWQPDEEVRSYLAQIVGYSLSGVISAQLLFFLWGGGQNGKSIFLGTLLDILADYGMEASSELLLKKREGSVPCDVAELAGRRFVSTIEVDQGRQMAEGLVKKITGDKRQKARFMRENFFEFDATHTIFLAANHKPVVKGRDEAIWRRIRLIPFTTFIPQEERDPDLLEKLQTERPGILKWAVQGCMDWQAASSSRRRGLRRA